MLEIKGLSHALGDKQVLKNIDLSVADGTILGIVGINGAGKSTLLRLLSGVYEADVGEILYDGHSVLLSEVRQEIFFLPDDPYYKTFTSPKSLLDVYECFYPQIDKELFAALLSEYKISMNGHLRNFSKGMRRQVFISLALSLKPKYLLLDEAFDGLDPLSRKIFKDVIIDHVEKSGGTVLISSHSLRELEDFCDQFILIDENTVKSQGDISEHVERLCKFELAFSREVNESEFEGLPAVSLVIKGHFVQIVLEGSSNEMKARLESLSPAVLDEMPLDFEEAFIHDVNKDRRP